MVEQVVDLCGHNGHITCCGLIPHSKSVIMKSIHWGRLSLCGSGETPCARWSERIRSDLSGIVNDVGNVITTMVLFAWFLNRYTELNSLLEGYCLYMY